MKKRNDGRIGRWARSNPIVQHLLLGRKHRFCVQPCMHILHIHRGEDRGEESIRLMCIMQTISAEAVSATFSANIDRPTEQDAALYLLRCMAERHSKMQQVQLRAHQHTKRDSLTFVNCERICTNE